MGYYQDTRICETHGFVLTPEGTCLRCLADVKRSARRRRWAKAVTGATVVVAAVCGITVARARVDTVVVTPAVASAPAAPAPTPTAAPIPVVAVSPPPSDDWDVALARAEAERQRVAAAQAAAEKQRQASALETPDPPPDEPAPRTEPQAPEATDPMFAPTRPMQRVHRQRGTGAANNPAAWGLPANNGGYFRNRGAGH